MARKATVVILAFMELLLRLANEIGLTGFRRVRGFEAGERNLPFTGLTKRPADLLPGASKLFFVF
jgi:hypothetical protein